MESHLEVEVPCKTKHNVTRLSFGLLLTYICDKFGAWGEACYWFFLLRWLITVAAYAKQWKYMYNLIISFLLPFFWYMPQQVTKFLWSVLRVEDWIWYTNHNVPIQAYLSIKQYFSISIQLKVIVSFIHHNGFTAATYCHISTKSKPYVHTT